MTTKERYFSQIENVIKSLNEQYYMTEDEYYKIANGVLHEAEMGDYSDDYLWGFADALRKVSEFFDDKI